MQINKAFRPGLIDWGLGSINQNSGRMHFLQNSNSALAHLKHLGFFIFSLGI